MSFFIFYIASVIISYVFLELLTKRIVERIEELGLMEDLDFGDEDEPSFSIWEIVPIVPILNLLFVIVGCLKSKEIINGAVKMLTGKK